MNQVDEIVDGVKEGIKRRIDSPFLASFALSFVAANYKLLLVIFGSGDYDKKIDYIEKSLYPSGKILQMGITPFLAAMTYTLLWPLAEGHLAAIGVWNENRKRRLILAQEKEAPVPYHEIDMFFNGFNQKNAELKERLVNAHKAAHASQLLMNEILEKAVKRGEEIAWGRLADSTNMGATEIREALQTGNLIQAHDNERPLKTSLIKALAAATAYILRLPSKNGLRITTLNELQARALDGYEEYALVFTVYEILRSLEIIGSVDETTGQIQMNSDSEPKAKKILRLFAVVDEPSQLTRPN